MFIATVEITPPTELVLLNVEIVVFKALALIGKCICADWFNEGLEDGKGTTGTTGRGTTGTIGVTVYVVCVTVVFAKGTFAVKSTKVGVILVIAEVFVTTVGIVNVFV